MKKYFLLFSLAVFSFSNFLSLASLAHDEHHEEKPSINISGSADKFVSPDVGELVLGMQVEDKSAAGAQTKVSAVLTAFTGQLKSIGLNANEIKTIQNSLNPVYDYSTKNPPYKVIAYRASQQVQIRVTGEERLNLLSKSIDLATKNSINTINSLNFSVSPQRMREVQKDLYSEASLNALETAKTVLASLGLKFTGVKNINVNYSQPYNNFVSYERMAKAAPAEGDVTSVSPGESRIQGTVNMTVEFAN
ncbi:MAG: SIMPL domain-containing protein [Candidatus Caenarcaniphilales bacterium]|nr:SIMPL domain-containing protein [Candidatus Caenarcaniphilales bacterium]